LRALQRQRSQPPYDSSPSLAHAQASTSDTEVAMVRQVSAAQATPARPNERLGLDAFDEDQDVRPIVLLSRKRSGVDRAADGAFMSDLERRLEAEPELGDEDEPRAADASVSGSKDSVRES